jgi:hypothetical protein
MKKAFTTFFFLVLAFTGCVQTQPAPNQKPAWIINPNIDNKRGAVGVAAISYDQKISTQRKLAITRALDELSLQQGVQVQLDMQKSEKYSNGSLSTSLDTQSSYKANSITTAHIEDVWEDKRSGELYIWMVID